MPQLPFSHFRLHFREGARSPLVTPPACGSYTSPTRRSTPTRAGAPLTSTSTFQIISGPDAPPAPPAACRPSTRASKRAPSTTPPAASPPSTSAHPHRLRTGDHPLLDQAAAGRDRQARRHPLLLRRRDRRRQARGPAPTAAPKSSTALSCPAASEVGRTLVGVGRRLRPHLRPRQGLPRRPLPRRPALDRRDHRRRRRPLRPRHRRRPRGPEDQPRNRRSLRRRHRLGPDPPHHQGHPRPPARHPRLRRPAELHPQPDQLPRTSTASTVLGSGLDFVSAADDNPFTVTSPFQAADCAASASSRSWP